MFRRYKNIAVLLVICCVAGLGIYGFRHSNYLRNIGQQMLNRPLPELKGGPEYSHRKGQLPGLQEKPGYNQSTINSNLNFRGMVYYSGDKNIKQAALTFDDGPDNIYTPKILDILKENNIKATFFIVGTRAQANPQMVKRILDEGHAIGNHSWSHPELDKLSPDKVKYEIKKTDDILETMIGFHPSIVRPPYGEADKKVVEEVASMGFKIVDWSVDTRDWAGTSPKLIMDCVKLELKPGAIILQHCAGGKKGKLENTVTALPEIIRYLKSEGYSFARIPELLNISPNL